MVTHAIPKDLEQEELEVYAEDVDGVGWSLSGVHSPVADLRCIIPGTVDVRASGYVVTWTLIAFYCNTLHFTPTILRLVIP